MAIKATKKAARRQGKQKAKPGANGRKTGQTGRPRLGTEDWAEMFLAALEEGLHARDAADAACVNIGTVYRRRRDEEAFRTAWAESLRTGTLTLEAEAVRRAYHGTLKSIYYKGEVCGHTREYSDQLLMFLLRGRDPEKYRDNAKFDHLGKEGAAMLGPTIYLPDNGRSKPDAHSDPSDM